MEEWKQIKDFENYYVSNAGRIYNTETKRFVGNKNSDKYRYKKVKLSNLGNKKLIDVHRLIATTFIPNPLNLKCVNHIDGNRENNAVENLEWRTYSENAKHAFSIGLTEHSSGESVKNSKLKEEDVRFIRQNYTPRSKKYSYGALAKMFGVSKTTIIRCISRKNWNKVLDCFSFLLCTPSTP